MKKLTVFFVVSLIFFASAVDLSDKSLFGSFDQEKIASFISSNSLYAIDDVLDLLQQLLDESNNDLSELETSYALEYETRTEFIQNITNIISDLEETCGDYYNTLVAFNETINSIINKIQEYQDIISQNQNRTEKLHDARCKANQNYILALTKNKNALALIAILRQAVEQFSDDSFLQKGVKKIMSLAQILSKIAGKNKKFIKLIQQDISSVPDVSERTSTTYQ